MTHLDNNTNTQTSMQQEISELKKKISGLNTTIAFFEKQTSRDQMIIKFRDATIK